jgi:hypothetical protein
MALSTELRLLSIYRQAKQTSTIFGKGLNMFARKQQQCFKT